MSGIREADVALVVSGVREADVAECSVVARCDLLVAGEEPAEARCDLLVASEEPAEARCDVSFASTVGRV